MPSTKHLQRRLNTILKRTIGNGWAALSAVGDGDWTPQDIALRDALLAMEDVLDPTQRPLEGGPVTEPMVVPVLEPEVDEWVVEYAIKYGDRRPLASTNTTDPLGILAEYFHRARLHNDELGPLTITKRRVHYIVEGWEPASLEDIDKIAERLNTQEQRKLYRW